MAHSFKIITTKTVALNIQSTSLAGTVRQTPYDKLTQHTRTNCCFGWHTECTGPRSQLVSNVTGDFLHECIEGHHTEVKVAPGAHCNGTSFFLLVACNQDVGKLLH